MYHDAVGAGDSGVNVASDARSTAVVKVDAPEVGNGVASTDACGDGAAAARASSLILESTRRRPSMRSSIVDCPLGICSVVELPVNEESDGVCPKVSVNASVIELRAELTVAIRQSILGHRG